MDKLRYKIEVENSGKSPAEFAEWMKANIDDFTLTQFKIWAKKNSGKLGDNLLIAVFDLLK